MNKNKYNEMLEKINNISYSAASQSITLDRGAYEQD